MTRWLAAWFQFDESPAWAGWHVPGSRWNGWERPAFTLAAMREIIEWLRQIEEQIWIEAGGVFRLYEEGEIRDTIEPEKIDGLPVDVYRPSGWCFWPADSLIDNSSEALRG